MEAGKKVFSGITKRQNVEFGLVAILVTCVLAFWLNEINWLLATILLSLITIITPVVFYPFAALWFGLSRVLSKISSTILLSLVFFVIVTPMGFFRRIAGKDSLKIRQFKKSRQSVMVDRKHIYTAADMADTF